MNRFPLFCILLGLLTGLASAAPSLEQIEGERLFALHVNNILSSKCLACHGDDKIKGELDLRTRDAMLKGGETSDKVLVPGNPAASLLITAIEWADPDYEMPPKENDRLDAKQISRMKRWVTLGAPWPDEATVARYALEERKRERTDEGVLYTTSGGQSDEWTYRRYQDEDLWAFRPVVRPELPDPDAHPVDAFHRATLKDAGVTVAPRADPRSLIRRITYDLTGLPPTSTEAAQFFTAWEKDSTAAWKALIDRLLDSPHYGERMAQHWLDVVRYADTSGFSNDYEKSNAWRYRDYVVRSFNQNKPYDQFVKEQLAGDEMDPENPELRVATGFLRMGPWGTAMVPTKVARQMYLDDLVNGVGQALLSTPMRCCKCHDHKFDPIPTQDYYRMMAAFGAAQPAEMKASFLPGENKLDFKEGKARVDGLWEFAEERRKALYEKQETAAREWFAANGKEYKDEKGRSKLPESEKPPRHVGLTTTDQGRYKVRKQDCWIWERRRERFQPLAHSVYNGPVPKFLNNRKLRPIDRKPDATVKTVIFDGGSVDAPGEPVTPGVLSAVGVKVAGDGKDPWALTADLDGRRLGFANWVTHPDNGLANRSIVNRIWQMHFGRGISATPNNFGAKGAKPTHPELLDWLAAEFVATGFDIKRMHRLILQSDAYRMGTKHPDMETLRNDDPNNHLLAYRLPRRLGAEELRDSMLQVTRELNPELGGLPVMPEMNMEVALQPRMIQFSIAPAYIPSRTPAQRNRRTLYAYRVRGQADPFLEVFNQPNPNESCETREEAAVTPQAFTLLNSEVMSDRSLAFAQMLEEESPKLETQIRRAFHYTLQRQPSKTELSRLVTYVQEMTDYHATAKPVGTTYPTHITRSLVEEFSGEPFVYEEWLPVFEKYVPDLKPDQASAQTRALADFALLLFNSNEFVYIY